MKKGRYKPIHYHILPSTHVKSSKTCKPITQTCRKCDRKPAQGLIRLCFMLSPRPGEDRDL
jgi:hypothetical protein